MAPVSRPGRAAAVKIVAIRITGTDLIDDVTPDGGPSRWLGGARLAIGVAQGLALFGCHRAFDFKLWPATSRAVFGTPCSRRLRASRPLAGLGHWPLTLAIWTLAAAVSAHWRPPMTAGARRGRPDHARLPGLGRRGGVPVHRPHLIRRRQRAAVDRRPIRPTSTRLVSTPFNWPGVALPRFWILLELGGGLFALIGLRASANSSARLVLLPRLAVAFARRRASGRRAGEADRGLRSVG